METTSYALPDPRRWLILGTVGLAQLMVVLDATIVNIALPSAQRALGFTTVDRQWVVTAYALAFGSLLLFGGRLGDLIGRKVTFLAGAAGFAAASAVGGAATSFGMLVAARAVQGAFGALLAPAALSILSTTFTDPKERGKAFGVYGAIVGAGGAIGLVLGGPPRSRPPPPTPRSGIDPEEESHAGTYARAARRAARSSGRQPASRPAR